MTIKNSDKLEWFRNARLGMFIHWGVSSILGRGEWIMYRERIPKEEYAKLADQFAPRFFDPEVWCMSAKRAGMKYLVLTTRHHDGFALFDSQHDPFNSVKTAAGRDFVAEFVKACRKYDLGVGLYYSLGDWRFGIMKESDSADGARRMVDLAHAQVKELVSNYGPIDILWYDGGWCYPSTYEDTMEDVRKFWRGDELNRMVREIQPSILINDRSGAPGDFGTPEGHVSPPGGGKLWEACLTMAADENSGWGYSRHSAYRKTPVQLIHLLVKGASQGGNVLLNVSPDPDGVIPAWQMELLERLGQWMDINGDAIYGVERTGVTTDVNGIQGNAVAVCSEAGNILYIYLLEWPGTETIIPIIKREVISAVLMGSDLALGVNKDDLGRLHITGLPENPVAPYCAVIKAEMC